MHHSVKACQLVTVLYETNKPLVNLILSSAFLAGILGKRNFKKKTFQNEIVVMSNSIVFLVNI